MRADEVRVALGMTLMLALMLASGCASAPPEEVVGRPPEARAPITGRREVRIATAPAPAQAVGAPDTARWRQAVERRFASDGAQLEPCAARETGGATGATFVVDITVTLSPRGELVDMQAQVPGRSADQTPVLLYCVREVIQGWVMPQGPESTGQDLTHAVRVELND